MTDAGEQLTPTGEFDSYADSILAFNINMGFSYTIDVENRDEVEVKMYYGNADVKDAYQMIFVMNGKLKFRARGKKVFNGQINANQHNLYRVTPGISRIVMDKTDGEVMCINLSRSFVNRYIPTTHPAYQKLTTLSEGESLTMLFPVNMHITPEIGFILQRLNSSSALKEVFFEQLMLESKVIELLALQIAQYEQISNDGNPLHLESEKRERIYQAREIIISHTGKQIPLKELALMVGTNEYDLKRDFKVVFGNTVYGYLKQYRMEQAKGMLIENDATVAEISQKVGYRHATHFTSAFKKYYGYLPNKLRTNKLLLLMLMQDFVEFFEVLDFWTL